MSRVRNQLTDVSKILSQGNGPRYLRKVFKECDHCYMIYTRNSWSLDLPKYRTVEYERNYFH